MASSEQTSRLKRLAHDLLHARHNHTVTKQRAKLPEAQITCFVRRRETKESKHFGQCKKTPVVEDPVASTSARCNARRPLFVVGLMFDTPYPTHTARHSRWGGHHKDAVAKQCQSKIRCTFGTHPTALLAQQMNTLGTSMQLNVSPWSVTKRSPTTNTTSTCQNTSSISRAMHLRSRCTSLCVNPPVAATSKP